MEISYADYLVLTNSALVAVGTLNTTLAILVLLLPREKKKRLWEQGSFWFVALSFTIGLWTFAMVNFRSTTEYDTINIYLRLLYITPLAIPICFFKLIEKSFDIEALWRNHDSLLLTLYRFFKQSIYVFSLVLAFLVLFSDLILVEASPILHSEHAINFGTLFGFYALYFFFAFGIGLFQLFWISLRGIQHLASQQKVGKALLLGSTSTITIPLFTNLILPWFNFYTLNWFGNLATLIWGITLFYAFYKFRFLNLKVFSIEASVFAIWTTLSVRTYLAAGERLPLLDLFVLALSIIIGVLLIRSMHTELEAKESLQQLTHQLHQANMRLRELDKQKTEFLSIASHQLRGPVAVVRGYSSLLREGSYGKLPPSAQEIIDRIEASSAAMAQMVDDFLNVTRIEQGRMQYDMHHFDLGQLVSLVCEEFSMRAKEKGLSFSCAIARQPAQYPYYGDQVKIRQVLANLIDNAIKYTPSGWVRVSLSRGRGAKQEYVVTVEDSGIGIPPEEIPTLFSKFHRASNVQGANVSGTGLGLYIAKRLVEAHSGSIRIFSEGRGKGSRFVITLPAFPTRISHNENATINN